MKIGFVYDMVYPFSKGGAEKRFYHLARRLAQRHEVHWVGLKLWKGPSTMVTDEGITLHGVVRPPGRMYVGGRRALLEPVWFGLALLQWPGLRDMDVIDCSSFPYFSTFSSRAQAFLGRKPQVVTWHEFWGDYWQEYAPRVAPVGRLVERLALACSPNVIAVSEHTRAKLVRAGVEPFRITVVPNGTDLGTIERAAPLPNGPDILFAGRLIREKRVAVLLEALAQDPLARLEATCWIVGDGPEAGNLKKLAGTLGLGARATFVPWMREDQLYGAMKSAKVVALLSEREGFGMVVLEAMACGTPVVVSLGRNSAAPELVLEGESGYIMPAEARAVSHAIASIVGSPDLRARMGARGKQQAAQYGWDEVTRQAEAVYVHAAGRTAEGTPPSVVDMVCRKGYGRAGEAVSQWPQRTVRMGLLAVPPVLLLACGMEIPGPLHLLRQVAGGLALIVAPGYAVLCSLKLNPLAVGVPGYRWPLVVPASLSVDVALGTLLVLTPVGLSACSLWAGLSALSLLSWVLVEWRR